MKRKIIFAAFAVCVSAACSKQVDDVCEMPESSVNLALSITSDETRTTNVTGEDAVNSLQVFVFGDGNRLEAHKAVTGKNSLEMGIFKGRKIIHALVNAPTLAGIVDYEDFYQSVSELADNEIGNFIMEGQKEVTVGTAKVSETIVVRRVASRVSLVKVENQLDPVYGDMELLLSKVYLINVVGDRTYAAEGHSAAAPTIWHHKLEYDASDEISDLTYEDLNDVKITAAAPHTTVHHFYCYPNPVTADTSAEDWSPRKTRMVVEMKLGNKLYYYPIALNVTAPNTEYHVSLTITRPGSIDPDIPYDPKAASVSVEVDGWKPGKGIDEVI